MQEEVKQLPIIQELMARQEKCMQAEGLRGCVGSRRLDSNIRRRRQDVAA